MRTLVVLSVVIGLASLGCGPSGAVPARVAGEPITPVRPPPRDAAAGTGGAPGNADAANIDPDPVPPPVDAPSSPSPPDVAREAAPVVDTGPPRSDAVSDAVNDVGPPRDTGRVDSNPIDVADTRPPVDLPSAEVPMACLPKPAMDEAISNFDMGSLAAGANGGRDATSWYVINASEGATATLTAPEGPPRCGSSFFLRFAGMASPTLTPILRLLFKTADKPDPFYDARAYKGLRFAIKTGVAARVRLKVPDRNTTSIGGVCMACSDHFGADIDATPAWTSVTIPFDRLKQSGIDGDRFPVPAINALYGLEFVVRGLPVFELHIDDISFYK